MAKLSALVAVGLLIAAPLAFSGAAAQSPNSPSDPNAKICETESQIGSRLAKKKVCATRAEWLNIRKDQRETVEWVQQRQGNMTCMPEGLSSSFPAGMRC